MTELELLISRLDVIDYWRQRTIQQIDDIRYAEHQRIIAFLKQSSSGSTRHEQTPAQESR